MTPYARHAVRNGHGRQAGTTREGRALYPCHAVGNGDGGQAATTRESPLPYACHATVSRNNAVFATYDQSFARGLNDAIPFAMKNRVFCRHRYGGQAATTHEDLIPYARHAVADGDGGQARAIIEGSHLYARHAVRNGDGGQTRAIIEDIPINSLGSNKIRVLSEAR